MEVNSMSKARRAWLSGMKSEIMELRHLGESDFSIRKSMYAKFRNLSTKTERIMGWVCSFAVIALVCFGLHISYVLLMLEAHVYSFGAYLSPYVSLFIFVLLCVALLGIFAFYFGYFVDFCRFYKKLDDTLEEQFYLKLFKILLILGFIGFVVFMVMVFFIGLQVSEFYNMPLENSLFEVLREIVD